MRKWLILLLVPILIGSFLAGCTQQSNKNNEIKIGVLLDLSGDLASEGQQTKEILSIEEENINNYFKEHNIPYTVKFFYTDTQCNPKICLDKVQALHAMGINAFIGPTSSSELKNIKDYVNSNKLIVISQSSTAPPKILGFETPEQKKYIFRFVPTDEFQGKAIASVLKDDGIKNIVIIYRDDAWGKGLSSAVIANANKLGLNVITTIPYPSTPSPTDWSPYIQKIQSALNGKSNKDTAVLVIGFDEVGTLLSQIPKDSPVLNYKWFGSDGTAFSNKVLNAGENAIKVGLYSTIFYSETDEAKKLIDEYHKKGFKGKVKVYPLVACDAAWVLSLSYAEMLNETKGKYDADLLAKLIKENTEKYSKGEFGVKPVTGYIKLNIWNDRASGNYGIFAVTKDGWKLVGIWNSETGKVQWIKKP
ncbi:ABC transporter substrate-binding protein [Methanocaldococcus indicus]|uniref:ABC transporter substrate-binding protein n=1 Tax=Methanocaldococcus indicus TaxID=213231 RepID=UPI003C6D9C29